MDRGFTLAIIRKVIQAVLELIALYEQERNLTLPDKPKPKY